MEQNKRYDLSIWNIRDVIHNQADQLEIYDLGNDNKCTTEKLSKS